VGQSVQPNATSYGVAHPPSEAFEESNRGPTASPVTVEAAPYDQPAEAEALLVSFTHTLSGETDPTDPHTVTASWSPGANRPTAGDDAHPPPRTMLSSQTGTLPTAPAALAFWQSGSHDPDGARSRTGTWATQSGDAGTTEGLYGG